MGGEPENHDGAPHWLQREGVGSGEGVHHRILKEDIFVTLAALPQVFVLLRCILLGFCGESEA